MGKIKIEATGYGSTMQDAFDHLQFQSECEDGNDDDNGTFGTLIEYVDKTADWKGSDLAATTFLQQPELMAQRSKREVNGVCVQEPTQGQPGEYVFVGWAAYVGWSIA